MSNSKWMENLWADIKSKVIWRTVLPGTHNSGVFSAWNTIGVRNQDQDIGAQLKGGIRSFDIRVTNGHGTFVMHHSGDYPPNSSQNLKPALEQMKSFAADNRYEIFVVQLVPGWGSSLKESEWPKVRKMVLDELENYLVPWSDTAANTLEEIHSQGKNIILLSGVGKEPGKENLFWDRGSRFIKDTWGSYQSECKPTPQEKIDWLKPHIEAALESPPNRFLYASCMIWTINLYDAAKQWTNPRVSSWVAEWAVDTRFQGGMNIFAVDFFDVWDNQVVNTLIALNKSRAVAVQSNAGQSESIQSPAANHIDNPYYRDSDSFNLAGARKTVRELGLDWHQLKHEYEQQGSLSDESLTALQAQGLPRFVVAEFLRWYADN